MRIVCLTIPEKGHLNPLLPTLRHLGARGHEVVVVAARDVVETVRAAGLMARTITLDLPPPPPDFITAGAAFAERLRDPVWLAGWIEALLIDAVSDQVPAIEAVLAAESPDVIVLDPMLYAGVIACARLGLPWAGLSSSLNPVTPSSWQVPLTETLQALTRRRREVFVAHGVDVPRFRVSDAVSPWLNIAFAVDAHGPRDDADANDVFSVGAPFDDDDVRRRDGGVAFDGSRLARRPLLYASFGSQAFFQPALFRGVFAAAERLGLQVIASVGDLLDDSAFMASAPHDAILCRFAPQLRVLPLVDVVVSHGGANSVVEALAADRPLVLLPLCNDQHLQARFLTERAIGAVVDVDEPGSLADAIERGIVQAREPQRVARVQAIGAALRGAGGPGRAASLVEQLGRERRPMTAAGAS
jgi:zeaxanthin glucosyltransferase